MNDLISRQAAIDWLANDWNGMVNTVFFGIENLSSAQQWIPCSERLPEEHLCDDGYVEPSDYVLVYGDYRNYGVSRYWGNRRSKSEYPTTYKDWPDLDWIMQKPIAWMPLPEPYKGE